MPAIFQRYPAQDAMRGDEIECAGQGARGGTLGFAGGVRIARRVGIAGRGELRTTLPRSGCWSASHGLPAGCAFSMLRRIEVENPEFGLRIGGGRDQEMVRPLPHPRSAWRNGTARSGGRWPSNVAQAASEVGIIS